MMDGNEALIAALRMTLLRAMGKDSLAIFDAELKAAGIKISTNEELLAFLKVIQEACDATYAAIAYATRGKP